MRRVETSESRSQARSLFRPPSSFTPFAAFKNGRTRQLTVVRRCRGDLNELAGALKQLCGTPEVHVLLGRIEVKGLHASRVKNFFEQQLGF